MKSPRSFTGTEQELAGFLVDEPFDIDVGWLVPTTGVQSLRRCDVFAALERHKAGDWPYTSFGDCFFNRRSVATGRGSVLTAWADDNGLPFWIYTEIGSGQTTVMMRAAY